MSTNEIKDTLLDAGLEERGVEKVIEEYSIVQTKFQNGEYAAVGQHSGRFCEGIRRILRYDMDDKYTSDDPVRSFSTELRNREDEGHYSSAIHNHLSNMLHTAWDIRSNRDAAHMNLETAVNKADAKLSVALCSSILVELVREFASEEVDIDVAHIANIIEELSVQTEENPLRQLIASKYEFDRTNVAEALDGLVSIVESDEDIRPGLEFHDLRSKQQVVALALGRLAAHDLGVINSEDVACGVNWFNERAKTDSVNKYLENTDYIEQKEYNAYFIPGYQAENAIAELE
jgi:hypothetical protein